MKKVVTTPTFIWFLSMFILYTLMGSHCIAAPDDTLLIRSAKMPRAAFAGQKISSRDPFNWPRVQIEKFKAQQKLSDEDPFADLKLTGIIWNAKLPLAIINKRLYKTGDTINGSQVQEISKNKVILKNSGLIHELKMEEKIINLNSGGDTG